jgi:branched-chain amino acid transport system substrate-binding protein
MTIKLQAIIVAAAVLAFGNITGQPARAVDPLELYALLPLTGPLAFYGQSILAAMSAQEQSINATGGVDGRQVHFTILDDQASPQIAVQLMSPLLAKGVPVIVDGGPAATCRATTALAKTDALVFCLSTAYTPASGTYSFSTPFSLEDSIAAQIRFFRVRGLKRMGFVSLTDATGQASEEALTHILAYPENKDVVAVGRERFAGSDISVSAQLARLRSGGPQAIMVNASGAPLGIVLRDLRDAGLTMPIATLASNYSIKQMQSYGASVPAELELVSSRAAAYSVMHGGPVKDAITVYRAAMKRRNVGLDGPASLAWDPIELIRGAYRKAGTAASPQKLYVNIAGARNIAGISGYYDFVTTPGRGLTSKDSVVIRWDPKLADFVPVSTAGGAAPL